MSWAEILQWWGYRPLLRSTKPPKAAEELVLGFWTFRRQAGEGGYERRKSGVLTLYQFPPETAYVNDWWGLVYGGALMVFSEFYADGDEIPYQGSELWFDKIVEVREHPANYAEWRRSERDYVDWRTIRWVEKVKGGALFWEVGNHPDLYTEKQTIDFTNALEEVR